MQKRHRKTFNYKWKKTFRKVIAIVNNVLKRQNSVQPFSAIQAWISSTALHIVLVRISDAYIIHLDSTT